MQASILYSWLSLLLSEFVKYAVVAEVCGGGGGKFM